MTDQTVMFVDRAPLTGVRRTSDGYLVAEARVARTGIQEYRGAEMGRPDMETVRVYRPEDEVFSRDSLATYAHRPVTNDHPAQPVTADNWKQLSIGQTGDEVARDGDFIRVPLAIMDAQAIADIEAGKRELSMGYTAAVDWTDGETPSGERYDAVQRSLKMNHLAIVSAARGGPSLKIGDSLIVGGPPMAEPKLRQVVVDGLTAEVTERDAQIIDKAIQGRDAKIADLEKQIADQKADADKAAGVKDAKIEELEKKVVDGAALDQLVTDRADIVGKAKALVSDYKPDGKANADIRREIVAAKLGEKYSKDWSDEYVGARFDAMSDGVKSADPVRSVLGDARTTDPAQMSDEDRVKRLKRMGIKVKED